MKALIPFKKSQAVSALSSLGAALGVAAANASKRAKKKKKSNSKALLAYAARERTAVAPVILNRKIVRSTAQSTLSVPVNSFPFAQVMTNGGGTVTMTTIGNSTSVAQQNSAAIMLPYYNASQFVVAPNWVPNAFQNLFFAFGMWRIKPGSLRIEYTPMLGTATPGILAIGVGPIAMPLLGAGGIPFKDVLEMPAAVQTAVWANCQFDTRAVNKVLASAAAVTPWLRVQYTSTDLSDYDYGPAILRQISPLLFQVGGAGLLGTNTVYGVINLSFDLEFKMIEDAAYEPGKARSYPEHLLGDSSSSPPLGSDQRQSLSSHDSQASPPESVQSLVKPSLRVASEVDVGCPVPSVDNRVPPPSRDSSWVSTSSAPAGPRYEVQGLRARLPG